MKFPKSNFTGGLDNVTSDLHHQHDQWVDAIADLHPLILSSVGFVGDWAMTTIGALVALSLCRLRKYAMRWFYAISAGMILYTSTIGLYSESLARASQRGTWSHQVPWIPVLFGSIIGIVALQATTTLVFMVYKWRDRSANQTKGGGYSVNLDETQYRVDQDKEVEALIEQSRRAPLLTHQIELERLKAEERLQPLQRAAVVATMGANKYENRATQEARRMIMIAGSMIIQQFPEGVMLGAAFANVWGQSSLGAQRQALRLAIGVTIGAWLTSIGEAAAIIMPMRDQRVHWCRIIIFVQLACMIQGFAVCLTCLTLTYVQPLLPFALSAAASMSVYVVCSEMIPAAYEKGSRLMPNILLWTGFLMMLIVVNLFN
jgi:zinc transporter ZupT